MEKSDYPCSIIPRKENETEISLIGVHHNLPFFKKYKKFYEEEINKSDMVIVEGGEYLMRKRSTINFFDRLYEVAYEIKVPVLSIDPQNINTNFLDYLIPFGSIAMGSLGTRLKIPVLPMLLHAGGLSGLFGNTLGTAIRLGALNGFNVEEDAQLKKFDPLIESLFLGEVDWRNVCIAKGLEEITEKENYKHISCFHGDIHNPQINFYLEHPKYREAKYNLYFIFNKFGEKEILKL